MSLELNKIAASVLTAGVVAMGTGFIADILIHPHVPEEPHYSVAVKADDGGAEPQEPAGPEPILPLLAEADPAAGEGSVRVCQACHSFEKGGPNKVGPNLYSLVGNQIAGAEGFSYSDALSGKEGEWTYEKLNHFLYDPQGWAPGTKMTYNGVKKVQDRANIVAYLRSLADEPAPLPTEEEVAAVTGGGEEEAAEGEAEQAEAETADSGGAEQGGDGGDGIAAKIAAADPAAGKSGSRVCMACHSFDEGGPNKVGPNLYNVVGGEIASVEGFNYSDALKNKEGSWTYEDLWAFLESPQGWAPGTRMTYPGVKDPQKRAEVIAYLREQSKNPPSVE